jgi:hypothetical protein
MVNHFNRIVKHSQNSPYIKNQKDIEKIDNHSRDVRLEFSLTYTADDGSGDYHHNRQIYMFCNYFMYMLK